MGLGPSFKNIRSLCNPQVLWQAAPQTWAVKLECLTVGFGSHVRND